MENGNESAKVPEAPPIPGNMAYIITRKPKVNQFSSIDTAFSDFLWCIKVRSKDITRPGITGILIIGYILSPTPIHLSHLASMRFINLTSPR